MTTELSMPQVLNLTSILGIVVGLMVGGYWLGTSLLFIQRAGAFAFVAVFLLLRRRAIDVYLAPATKR